VPDYRTVDRLGNNAVCEDGSVGMPDYITVARLGTMPYVRMEVLGCPIIFFLFKRGAPLYNCRSPGNTMPYVRIEVLGCPII